MMFHITPIQEEHIEGLHRVLDTVAREQPFLGIEKAPPVDHMKTQIEQHIQARHPFLVAMENDELIGWCSILPYPQNRFRFTGTLFIGVLSHKRGLGIGTALIRSALSAAWEADLRRVELEVCASNANAVQLYRKLGFADEGTKRCAYFVNEQFEDILVMSLLRERLNQETREEVALAHTA